jgi:hypothetical protein
MTELISKPIENKILVSNRLLQEVIQKYKGKQVIVSIEEFSPKKSSQKRRGYFASIVAPMRKGLGYESNDIMHEVLKKECNPVEAISTTTGEITIIGGSTKKFTPDEWDSYKQRCRDLAESLGYKLMTEAEYYESLNNENDEQVPIGE